MSNRDASSRFDGARFMADVRAYMCRFNVSGRSMAAAAELDLASLYCVFRGERSPSLLIACSLADVADLSLDAYRMPSERDGLCVCREPERPNVVHRIDGPCYHVEWPVPS